MTVGHPLAYTEGPRRQLVGAVDAVDQRAQRRRGDGDAVADVMGEALALAVAVLDRREHGAEEQHEAVRVLVVGADGLAHQVERVAADLAHVALAFEQEAVVLTLDPQRHMGLTYAIQREALVEQADERTDGAG